MGVLLNCVYPDCQFYALNPNYYVWGKTSRLQMEVEEEWASILSMPKKTRDQYADDRGGNLKHHTHPFLGS